MDQLPHTLLMLTLLGYVAGALAGLVFLRAERLANQAPVKMLAPLILFIFPSVFLVLLGPIIARLCLISSTMAGCT